MLLKMKLRRLYGTEKQLIKVISMRRIIWEFAYTMVEGVRQTKQKLMNGIEKQRNKVMLMRRII